VAGAMMMVAPAALGAMIMTNEDDIHARIVNTVAPLGVSREAIVLMLPTR
jgi:hypothetical protein